MTNFRDITLVAFLCTLSFLNSACLPTVITDAINNANNNLNKNGNGNDDSPTGPNGGNGDDDGNKGNENGGNNGVGTGILSQFVDHSYPNLRPNPIPPPSQVKFTLPENALVKVDRVLRYADPGSADCTRSALSYADSAETIYGPIKPLSDYEGFSIRQGTSTVSGQIDPIDFIGYIHDDSSSVAVIDEVGGLAVAGTLNFESTPSGTFVYTGLNILRYYSSEDLRGFVQDETFAMSINFAEQTGQLIGSAVSTTSKLTTDDNGNRIYETRSTISGNIWVNKNSGEFGG